MSRSRSAVIAAARFASTFAGVVVLFAPVAACKHDVAEVADAAPPPAPSAPVAKLAPNELVEGKDLAFGLPLPALMLVDTRLGLTVTARGRIPHKDIDAYLQKHVAGGSATLGDHTSTFTDVHALGEPTRPLLIKVSTDGMDSITFVDVHDNTPTPIVPISPQDAWKQQGITPNNKIIDPLQLR